MPRAKSKVIRASLAKTRTGIQGLDEVTGGACRKVASRWYVAARVAARAYSAWSFWCMEPLNTASREYI
jgi:hypothetical protein